VAHGEAESGPGVVAARRGEDDGLVFFIFSEKLFAECFLGTRQRLCRVRDKKTLGKLAFADTGFAECNTRQTLCRVFFGLHRVPPALGKPPVSSSFLMQSRIHTCIGELL